MLSAQYLHNIQNSAWLRGCLCLLRLLLSIVKPVRPTENQQPGTSNLPLLIGNSFDTYPSSDPVENQLLTRPRRLQTCCFSTLNNKPQTTNPAVLTRNRQLRTNNLALPTGAKIDTYNSLYWYVNKGLTRLTGARFAIF